MNKFIKKIAEKWSGLSKAKKSIVIVMGISVLLASFFFFSWATKVNYAPLFTNLEPNSAGKIVERLEEMAVPYKLGDQGRSVLVPSDEVYELRLRLANEGIFEGAGQGFELFDKSPLGTTDFERNLNYQRALQEELRRTIVQLEPVEQARVHLVIPEKSVFVREEAEPSASVALNLKAGADLEADQVNSIVQLVAHSVENLKPENITVIDQNGRVLNDDLDGDLLSGSTAAQKKQLEMKKAFEKDLEKRVLRMLEKIYGPGRVVVMINADLDFSQRETTRIEWGDEGVIRSQQEIQEESTTTSQGNLTGDPNREYPTADQNEQDSSNRTENITNYEIDMTEDKVIYAPGRLNSLSTAVSIDGVLSEEDIDTITQIVEAAVGYMPDRGDRITVTSIQFDDSEARALQEEMDRLAREEERRERIQRYITWGIIGLATLLGLIIVTILVRRFRRREEPEETIEEPVSIEELEKQIEKKALQNERVSKQKRIQDLAQKKPKEVMQILQSWLSED